MTCHAEPTDPTPADPGRGLCFGCLISGGLHAAPEAALTRTSPPAGAHVLKYAPLRCSPKTAAAAGLCGRAF
jgi:hypothetical protein